MSGNDQVTDMNGIKRAKIQSNFHVTVCFSITYTSSTLIFSASSARRLRE